MEVFYFDSDTSLQEKIISQGCKPSEIFSTQTQFGKVGNLLIQSFNYKITLSWTMKLIMKNICKAPIF
jgi:hypothetical protein